MVVGGKRERQESRTLSEISKIRNIGIGDGLCGCYYYITIRTEIRRPGRRAGLEVGSILLIKFERPGSQSYK